MATSNPDPTSDRKPSDPVDNKLNYQPNPLPNHVSGDMPWSAAKPLIDAAHTVIVVTHVFPDGDAIGSLLGVTFALRGLGKTVIPAVDGGVPKNLQFMPGSADVRADLNAIPATPQPVDLIVSVDCSDVQRTGIVGQQALALGKPLIMVDHHRTNTLFGAVNLLSIESPSCAEVVKAWLDDLHAPLSPEIASNLLTGIVTDTLCFRVSSVTPATIETAYELMQAGASLPDIAQRTVNRRSTAAIRLWSQALPTLHIEEGAAWVVVDKAMLAAANYTEEGGAGGLVQLLNEVDEAQVACVFREKEDGQVEVNLRAQPGFNVSTLATSLGGGGHVLASGATVPGPIAETVARIVPMIKAAAKVGTPTLV